MDKRRWRSADTIFEQALQRAPETREAFLIEACGDDRELRREVADLLRHHDAAEDEGFLDRPNPLGESLRGEPPPDDPYIGKDLGPYRVQKRQGGGGMGNVYLAVRQAEFRQQVAIKLLRRSIASEDVVERFRNEMQVLAALGKHENIAALFDAGRTDDGLPYFVMEFVDGEPIDAYCDHHRHSIGERIALFRQVCAAVHFAHQHMIIHRDLKMGNILVRVDGVPKLIDFGIAKLASPELASQSMAAAIGSNLFMTADYASPEQARGDSLTTASDVYSLGVVLYELLAGRRPYDLAGLSRDEQLRLVCDLDPAPPSSALDRTPSRTATKANQEDRGADWLAKLRGTTARRLRSRLTGDLDAIVLKTLRKAPQQRYGTALELSEDLGRFLEGRPVEARPAGPLRRACRWSQRNPVPAALLATVLMTLVGGLWHLSRLSDQLVQATAIEGATLEAQTLSIVQDFYAKTVVDKVKDRVPVTHRYAVIEGAIPVPASFTIDLGEHIRKSQANGMFARLYSEYPFAQREGGGPQDDFEVWALQVLRADPGKPAYRFETYEGRPSLRYAAARIMKESCVECHNGHPDSVKTDWKVGELRGVLEIIRPIDLDIARVHERLRETFFYMIGVSALLLGLAGFFLRGGRKG